MIACSVIYGKNPECSFVFKMVKAIVYVSAKDYN